MQGEPYCGECGYVLKGLTESSKCPECGKPIVDVLQRGPAFRGGRRFTSDIVIFGLPLVSIAIGPSGNEARGHAKGIIAIGDVATGWLAFGGMARGIVAVGGFAFGVFSLGGFSLGLIAFGGFAAGGIANGGFAAGGLAHGGGAVGVIARGGGVCGYYAQGGGVTGVHVIAPGYRDPKAVALFDWLDDWIGAPSLGGGPMAVFRVVVFGLAWLVISALAVAAIPAAAVLIAYSRRPRASPR